MKDYLSNLYIKRKRREENNHGNVLELSRQKDFYFIANTIQAVHFNKILKENTEKKPWKLPYRYLFQ